MASSGSFGRTLDARLSESGDPFQGTSARRSYPPLHTALQSARLRKYPRPPLPEAVVGCLGQAVQSAKRRTARPPSSPTLETLYRVANSAKARGHSTRSLSLGSILDVVRSAEARGQASQLPPSIGALLQVAQSATARKAAHPSPVKSRNLNGQDPSPTSPTTTPLRGSQTDPLFTDAKSHNESKSEQRKRGEGPASPTAESPELEHGALAEFFRQYQSPGFKYDPNELPLLEFRRLVRFLGLRRDDPESRALDEDFGKAMVAEFGIKFGSNMNDLSAWQRLCKRIGIEPIPTTLAKARREFRKTHVNIVELMMARIPDGGMEMFDTEEELAEYTRSRPGLTFPRAFVETGGILWYLLRRIWMGEIK